MGCQLDIEKMLKLIGIDESFRKMMMSCVTKVSMSALVEGSSINIIRPRRGVRQGNSLSLSLSLALCHHS